MCRQTVDIGESRPNRRQTIGGQIGDADIINDYEEDISCPYLAEPEQLYGEDRRERATE
jgi:hypothetical protein